MRTTGNGSSVDLFCLEVSLDAGDCDVASKLTAIAMVAERTEVTDDERKERTTAGGLDFVGGLERIFDAFPCDVSKGHSDIFDSRLTTTGTN